MTDDDDLSPEAPEAFERIKSRAAQFVDPIVVGILKRALEVARREERPTVTLKEVLEAFLHATITPGLIHHLQATRAIAEDERGNEYVYVDDISTFAAQLAEPTSLVYQLVERHVADMDAFVALVWRNVRETPPPTDS